MKIGDAIFGNKEQVNGPSLNPLRDTVGALTKRPELYDTFEFLTEIGVASIAPITVGGVPKTSTKNSNSNSTISGKSNSQNHNWNLNGKSGDYLDKTTRKVKVTPNITETIKNSNINASKSTNWGLGNLNSKNIMDTTVGSYLNNLNSKVNNNKSYDPTPKLDYNKPLDNSLYKGVKNSEGNYTLGRGNEWNFDTKTMPKNLPYSSASSTKVPSNSDNNLVNNLEYSRSVQEKAIETYHKTPVQFDYEMIKYGTSLNRIDGRVEYMMKGYVNGKEGIFHTTIKEGNKVIHKNFVPKSDWMRYSTKNQLPNYDKIK